MRRSERRKKDIFGIKQKLYVHKVRKHIRKGLKIRMNSLQTYLDIISDSEIGSSVYLPSNAQKRNMLLDAICSYDRIIGELEDNYLKKARASVSDELKLREVRESN